MGSTGCDSGNHIADKADLIIGVGTRYSDFTTASKTQFKNPDVKFVNINVTPFDAAKESAEMVVADAREALAALTEALADYRVEAAYSEEITAEKEAWLKATERCYHLDHGPLPAQTEVFGALNELMGEEDVVHQRRRLHARRPPGPVAGPQPAAVPRGVRLLLHGLRGARRHGRQARPP